MTYPCLKGFGDCKSEKTFNKNKTFQYPHISVVAFQITGDWTVSAKFCSYQPQREHQRSILLVFVRGIHRWLTDFPEMTNYTESVSVPWRHLLLVICNMKGLNLDSVMSDAGDAIPWGMFPWHCFKFKTMFIYIYLCIYVYKKVILDHYACIFQSKVMTLIVVILIH